MFKCGLSANCDVNGSRSWSDPHGQLSVNDITHRRLFPEANVGAVVEASLYICADIWSDFFLKNWVIIIRIGFQTFTPKYLLSLRLYYLPTGKLHCFCLPCLPSSWRLPFPPSFLWRRIVTCVTTETCQRRIKWTLRRRLQKKTYSGHFEPCRQQAVHVSAHRIVFLLQVMDPNIWQGPTLTSRPPIFTPPSFSFAAPSIPQLFWQWKGIN